METLTIITALLNTGLLVAIHYRLGIHTEKHKVTEYRLTELERKNAA